MKRLYLSDQDVESLVADYLANNNEKAGEGLTVNIEKTFDSDGYIVGVRLNFSDESGNIVTGYQETHGIYGDDFSPVNMQDGEGGCVYVTKRSEITQLQE